MDSSKGTELKFKGTKFMSNFTIIFRLLMKVPELN